MTAPQSRHLESLPIRQELLEVLQTSRSRLAVLVAAEAKRLPPAGRQFYFEIDRQARRWARRLRASLLQPSEIADTQRQALVLLRRLNASGDPDPQQVCRTLQEILSMLEPAQD